MTKLQSSTNYRFRLIAENELGRSRTSEIVAFQTQGTAPPKPQPPGLKEATKSSLHLVWSKRLTDSVSFSHREKTPFFLYGFSWSSKLEYNKILKIQA